MDGKLLNEARGIRYLLDALDDITAAEVLLEKRIYNLVLFHCQQTSEKGSKACLSLLGIILADEHRYADFLQKVVVPSSGKLQNSFKKLMVKVSIFENFYISARYGVDKTGRIRLQEFRESDGVDAFNSANDFLEFKYVGEYVVKPFEVYRFERLPDGTYLYQGKKGFQKEGSDK